MTTRLSMSAVAPQNRAFTGRSRIRGSFVVEQATRLAVEFGAELGQCGEADGVSTPAQKLSTSSAVPGRDDVPHPGRGSLRWGAGRVHDRLLSPDHDRACVGVSGERSARCSRTVSMVSGTGGVPVITVLSARREVDDRHRRGGLRTYLIAALDRRAGSPSWEAIVPAEPASPVGESPRRKAAYD